MNGLHVLASAAVLGGFVSGCGGGGPADAPATPAATAAAAAVQSASIDSLGRGASYSSLVVFGDSLSDVGSYRTPGVAAIGGGEYTVNGAHSAIWTELLARELALAKPCPAQTGLESSGPLAFLAAPTENHAGCLSYAEGGARVTDPVGPSNKALLALGSPSGYVGQLTDPLVSQIARHLAASGGAFNGGELVAVLAGANDLFMQLATLQGTVAAGGDANAAAAAAATAMGQAGAELAGYIRQQIVAHGARRVVVVTLPDVGKTPSARAETPATQALITLLATTFNAQLAGGLSGTPGVLLVDAFGASQDQAAHPRRYGLSNVTDPACALNAMLFPSALVCSTPGTVIAGDVSHYSFADAVHPTPYGHRLLMRLVAATMTRAGWLAPIGSRPCQRTTAGCELTSRDA